MLQCRGVHSVDKSGALGLFVVSQSVGICKRNESNLNKHYVAVLRFEDRNDKQTAKCDCDWGVMCESSMAMYGQGLV